MPTIEENLGRIATALERLADQGDKIIGFRGAPSAVVTVTPSAPAAEDEAPAAPAKPAAGKPATKAAKPKPSTPAAEPETKPEPPATDLPDDEEEDEDPSGEPEAPVTDATVREWFRKNTDEKEDGVTPDRIAKIKVFYMAQILAHGGTKDDGSGKPWLPNVPKDKLASLLAALKAELAAL